MQFFPHSSNSPGSLFPKKKKKIPIICITCKFARLTIPINPVTCCPTVSVFTKIESATPRHKTADLSCLTVNLIIMLLETNALITSAVKSLHERIPNHTSHIFHQTNNKCNTLQISPLSNFLRLGGPPADCGHGGSGYTRRQDNRADHQDRPFTRIIICLAVRRLQTLQHSSTYEFGLAVSPSISSQKVV